MVSGLVPVKTIISMLLEFCSRTTDKNVKGLNLLCWHPLKIKIESQHSGVSATRLSSKFLIRRGEGNKSRKSQMT